MKGDTAQARVTENSPTGISVEKLVVSYSEGKGGPAVDDLTLQVKPGAFGVLLGASGCGKSTALNCIAGLLRPNSGRILIGDRVVFDADRNVNVKPNHRSIGMVFQSYALWPHMSVLENVEYGLRLRGFGTREARAVATRNLELVRCAEHAARYPGQLSGGQQQRVALARALAWKPSVVLFDEPLSNLDTKLRRELRTELARLHKEVGFTALYVTHDQSEAFGLGSHIYIMRDGRVEQQGQPEEISRAPASTYVADFLGANLWTGTVQRSGSSLMAETAFGKFEVHSRDPQAADGAGYLAAYPEDLRVAADPHGMATIDHMAFTGRTTELILRAAGSEADKIMVVVPGMERSLAVGSPVRLSAEARSVHWYGRQAAGGAAAPFSPGAVS
ncbi:MAG: ABC transporter ATP-binding protein [Reyranellaceae bacterium]